MNNFSNNAAHTPVREAHPWGWAIAAGALLALIFFGTYNGVNQYTATLEPVRSFFFAWEKNIPFWPWTIVPYWSIDLFYGAALFLAATKTALLRLVKRLLLAQFMCISGFLLFPLKFSFVRPATDGFFGGMFDALSQFDLPYNQAPSLHIVLLLVLWREYRTHTTGSAWRYVVDAWCALIALSVLTTWQHHVVDLVTGLWVGAFCLLVIPEQSSRRHSGMKSTSKRYRLANYYLAGSLLFILATLLFNAVITKAIFCWFASAVFYVAMIYRFGNTSHLGKQQNGTIPLSHYFFLGPYYLGARISAWLHLRNREHYSEIMPNLFVGALSAQRHLAQQLAHEGRGPLNNLVDLAAELPTQYYQGNYYPFFGLDLLPLHVEQLQHAANIIEQARRQGTTMVCCALGVSRSATAVAAWLILHRGYSADTALAFIQEHRHCIIISSAQRDILLQLSAQ